MAFVRPAGQRRGHRHDAPGQRGPGALERAPAGHRPDLRHHLRRVLHPGGSGGHSHRHRLRGAGGSRHRRQHPPVRNLHRPAAGPGLDSPNGEPALRGPDAAGGAGAAGPGNLDVHAQRPGLRPPGRADGGYGPGVHGPGGVGGLPVLPGGPGLWREPAAGPI